MRNQFFYNGRSSADFGLLISGIDTFSSTSRDVTSISIPGRNGDLLIDNGRYHNIDIVYDAAIAREFREKFDAFRAFMLSSPGYNRLEDTYHPDEYRMAAFSAPMSPDLVGTGFHAGKFSVGFNCKPQRFLKSGETPITLSAPRRLYNSGFQALPLITVYGSGAGTLTVGGVTVQLKAIDGYVTMDCDLQDAYKGLENKNSTIYAPQFPVLQPGENLITWTGGVTRVEITPRWWTL